MYHVFINTHASSYLHMYCNCVYVRFLYKYVKHVQIVSLHSLHWKIRRGQVDNKNRFKRIALAKLATLGCYDKQVFLYFKLLAFLGYFPLYVTSSTISLPCHFTLCNHLSLWILHIWILHLLYWIIWAFNFCDTHYRRIRHARERLIRALHWNLCLYQESEVLTEHFLKILYF